MKKTRLLLVISLLIVGVATAVPTTKTIREGEIEFDIVMPSIAVPDVVYPDIRYIELAKISIMSPEVAVGVFIKTTEQGLLFYDTTKTTALIQRLNVSGIGIALPILFNEVKTAKMGENEKILDIFKVIITKISLLSEKEAEKAMSKLSPSGKFFGQEAEFYDAWAKKDFRQINNILNNISFEQAGFFTAWGEPEQRIRKTNFLKSDNMFSYKVFFLYDLAENWETEFTPTADDFILVINFSPATKKLRALFQLIEKHKNQIKLVVVPFGDPYTNNFDNKNIETYPYIAQWADKIFFSIKEIKPDLPVYLTVSFTGKTMDVWVKSFKAKYDGLALWNITSPNANFIAVYEQTKKYNPNIILLGMFGYSTRNYPKHKISWDKVKNIIPATSNKIREAGFRGVIWIKH